MTPAPLHRSIVAVLLCLTLAPGPAVFAARPVPREEPQAFKLRLSDPYLALEVEERTEDSRFPDRGTSSSDATLDFTPSAGISLDGSIYHPSVLSYAGSVEQGLTLGQRDIEDDGGRRTDDRNFRLERYNLSMTAFREKAVPLTLHGSKSRDRRDFGDFQRFTTDNENLGLRTSYSRGAWPVTLALNRWTETVDDPDRPTFRRENTLTLGTESLRGDRDRTMASLAMNDFVQEENGETSNQGTVTTLTASDAEFFGVNDRNKLFSTFYLNDLDSDLTQTRSLSLRESLHLQHYRNLWSEYAYMLDYNSAGEEDTVRNTVEADLNHRLAASLDSRVGALAETVSSGGSDSQRTYRYGPRIGENYRKRLGSWGRLRLNAGADYYRESQNGGGGQLAIVNEQLRLSDGEPAFLERPDVESGSIVITDRAGSTLYLEGADYRVATRGRFTEIQRVFGGRIPNGSTVNASYRATAQPGAHVSTLDSTVGAELALWRDLVVLYASRRTVDSSGGESLTFQNLDDTIAGVRVSRRWFSLGYEHGEHGADALDYTSDRTFEQLTIPIVDDVAVALEASQSRVEYPEVGDRREISTYSARYQQQVLASVWCSLAGGLYNEDSVNNGSRDVRTIEAEVQHRYGRLDTRFTYRIENEENQGEERDRHWLYVRIVRRF